MSFESNKIKKKLKRDPVFDGPINEDIECEDKGNYLSDISSSSTFSYYFYERMSFDLTKIIDKLDP